MTVRSRRGSRQIRHCSSSATLPQISQNLHLFLDLEQDLSKTLDVDRIGREQVERDALRALRTDVRQLAQLVDQILNDTFVHVLQSEPGQVEAADGRRVRRGRGPSLRRPHGLGCEGRARRWPRTAARIRSARRLGVGGVDALGSMTQVDEFAGPVTVALTSPTARGRLDLGSRARCFLGRHQLLLHLRRLLEELLHAR